MRKQICDRFGWPLWFRPIAVMQRYLREISRYYPAIPAVFSSGTFGPDTTRAVTAFQQEFGLSVTGNIDLATWETIAAVWRGLERLTADSGAYNLAVPRGQIVLLAPGEADNQLIDVLQTVLQELADRYQGLPQVRRTGVYDEQTCRAVQKFQQLAGLSMLEEPCLDRPTWNRLLAFWGNCQTCKG